MGPRAPPRVPVSCLRKLVARSEPRRPDRRRDVAGSDTASRVVVQLPRGGDADGARQRGPAGVRAGAVPRGRDLRPGAVPRLRVRRAHRLPASCPSWCCSPATPSRSRPRCGSAHEHGVPFVARGAGTGLSGGALPVADGVVITLARLNRILEVDPVDRRAVVEPGVTTWRSPQAAAPHGLYYAPDPSSQQVCTIGGNVAENSGGAHCLKYGFTTNHVLAVEVVLADGSRGDARHRRPASRPGRTCAGVFARLGGHARASSRRSPCGCCGRPSRCGRCWPTSRRSRPRATWCRDVVAAGHRARRHRDDGHAGDRGRRGGRARGLHVGVPARADRRARRARRGVRRPVRAGQGDLREARLHAAAHRRIRRASGRRSGGAARRRSPRSGRISPDYFVQDGVVPRTRLAEVLDRIAEMGAEAGLRVANVFHAGDGNLHPLVLYRRRGRRDRRAEHLSGGIAELCVELGGSLSGEHGIGTDKACSMPKMFSEDDLAVMHRVRAAFDPDGLCNPGKVFPTPRLCGERPGKYQPAPAGGGRSDRADCEDRRSDHDCGRRTSARLRDARPRLRAARSDRAAPAPPPTWAGRSAPVDAVLDTTALDRRHHAQPGRHDGGGARGHAAARAARRAGRARPARRARRGPGRPRAPRSAACWPPATPGPRALVYGSLRDLVIGVTLVLADGTIARSGGHVIKNVAGYDLAKVVHGSYGTLAVVAEVVLRLHPVPEAAVTLGAAVHAGRGGGGRGPGARWPHRARGAGVDQRRRRSCCGSKAPRPRWPSGPTARARAARRGRRADRRRRPVGAARRDHARRPDSPRAAHRRAAVAPARAARRAARDDGDGRAGHRRRDRPRARGRRRGDGARRRARRGRHLGAARPPGRGAPARVGPATVRVWPCSARSSTAFDPATASVPAVFDPADVTSLPGASFDTHRPPARELLDDCVHCGFCLPTCPTYQLWGEEMDSPRGRIYLMNLAEKGEIGLDGPFATHIDRCLGCMACVTACPSGVQYDRLLEATRPQMERNVERDKRRPAVPRRDLRAVPLQAAAARGRRSGRGSTRQLRRIPAVRALAARLPGRLARVESLLPPVSVRERVRPAARAHARRRRAPRPRSRCSPAACRTCSSTASTRPPCGCSPPRAGTCSCRATSSAAGRWSSTPAARSPRWPGPGARSPSSATSTSTTSSPTSRAAARR